MIEFKGVQYTHCKKCLYCYDFEKCCFEYWEHECLKCNNNECNTGRKGYFVEFDKVVKVEEVE